MSEKLPERYQAILHRPHPISTKHPPMPREKRAAQFAPFAALTGYEDAIQDSIQENQRAFEERDTDDGEFDGL